MTAGQIRAPTCIPLKSTPGGKQNVDDDTPIELSCDTGNTRIFYTLNGEKPVPFDNKNKHTYTYTAPFLLTPGKRTIKSVAAFPDGRQSNTVTKVYWVTPSAPPLEDGLDKLSLDSQLDRSFSQDEDAFKRRILTESFRHNIQTLPPGGLYTANRAKLRTSPTGSPLSSPTRDTSRGSGTPSRKRRSMKAAPSPAVSEEGVQTSLTFTKETAKCPECFTDKPPNPLAKYCHQCAHYLPPIPVGVDTVKCLHCHSVIPSDVGACVVCGARVTTPKIVLPINEPIVCGSCRFKNPPESKTCVVCEERLELTITAAPSAVVAPPPPSKPDKPAREEVEVVLDPTKRHCGKCKRGNALEARYCDWCGGSLVDISEPLACTACRFLNPPLALFCGNCGLSLLPKARSGGGGGTPTGRKVCWSDEVSCETGSRDFQPAGVIPVPEPLLVSTDTQTDGIFFKSARRLQEEENKITENMRQVYKSRGLSITKFSPGGGNWRQNVEHLTNHIKVYSQLSSEYQEMVGKHQLGKLCMATLYKDLDEVNLSFIFTTRKPVKTPPTRGAPPNRLRSKSASLGSIASSGGGGGGIATSTPVRAKRSSVASTTSDLSDLLKDELKSRLAAGEEGWIERTRAVLQEGDSVPAVVVEQQTTPRELGGSTTSVDGDCAAAAVESKSPAPAEEETLNKNSTLRKSIKKKVPLNMHELRIGKLNTQLLSEIMREGDEYRTARLIGQGANPNTKNSGGVPLLCLAAKNRHFGAFKALVEGGADIAAQVPSTKDTTLHVAVQQGSQDIVKFLVSKGADFSTPNIAGKTALDVARERHNQRAVQLFTASLGSSLLGMK